MIRFIIGVSDFILRYGMQICLLGFVICLFRIANTKQNYVEQLGIIRKANLRVPYNPLYKNTEYKDWQRDSTMTQGKIETLNEFFVR